MERPHVAIRLAVAVLTAATFAVRDGAAQVGYAIDDEKIVTNTPDQWEEWLFPLGTLDISESGVRSHYVPRELNASLDAGRFPLGVPSEEKEGGIARAGSGAATARLILDGNPLTFWDPDVDDSPENWYVVIDLGRLVSATRIALRFAQGDEGDPFYQFRVLVSDGALTLGASQDMDYHLVGRSERPNLAQRDFTFQLAPFHASHDADFTGDGVRFVQVVMTDSRKGMAEEVADRTAYEALPSGLQGNVEYYGRSREGRDWLVGEEAYSLLDAAEQGAIRYYRREHPRLAEVEVWTLGENVALGTLPRGGQIAAQGNNQGKSVDGDRGTYHNFKTGYSAEASNMERRMQFDLGALYWIDRIQLFGAAKQGDVQLPTVGSYRAKISDGSRAPDGTLAWTQVADQPARHPPRWQELRFGLSKVRFIIFDYLLFVGGGHAATGELAVFGEGYQPEVVLESRLIDLGGTRNLTTLHWDADVPSGTGIQVATRTGDQTKTVTHYYRKDGAEISQQDWEKSIKPLRGPTTEEVVVDDDYWSSWSKSYQGSGDEITSPSPRRYLKTQVRLVSEDPDGSAQLRRLEVRFSEPWVSSVLGEMYPVNVATLAEETELTFFVRPERGVSDPGVDEVLLVSSGRDSLRLAGVRLGAATDFTPGGGGREVDPTEVTVKATAPESLWVQLPEPVPRHQVVAVDVATVLYGHALAFAGRVGNRENEGAWQRVEAGDAAPQIDSQILQALAPAGRVGLSGLEFAARVATPNGDGVNDAVVAHFEVLRMDGAQPVVGTVYDLAGHRVWQTAELRQRASGRYTVAWPGVDQAGTLVSPGVYLLRLEVRADADIETTVVRPVYVAY